MYGLASNRSTPGEPLRTISAWDFLQGHDVGQIAPAGKVNLAIIKSTPIENQTC